MTKKLSDAVYQIKLLDTGKQHLVHYNILKSCYSPVQELIKPTHVSVSDFSLNEQPEMDVDRYLGLEAIPVTSDFNPDDMQSTSKRPRRMPVWTRDYDT